MTLCYECTVCQQWDEKYMVWNSVINGGQVVYFFEVSGVDEAIVAKIQCASKFIRQDNS